MRLKGMGSKAAKVDLSAAQSAAMATLMAATLAGCAHQPPKLPVGPAQAQAQVSLPLLQGWIDGEAVQYITTDVSHADVAAAKGANFAPRLALALPVGPPQPGRRSAVDKVYAVANFEQPSVFASAPRPVGPASRDTAYSPLWQMVKVTWQLGHRPRELKAEEEVLEAAERGEVVLEPTPVILNCPVIARAGEGTLPGVGWTRSAP
jgi:hypothetical protein